MKQREGEEKGMKTDVYTEKERAKKARDFFLPNVFIGSSPWELLVAT